MVIAVPKPAMLFTLPQGKGENRLAGRQGTAKGDWRVFHLRKIAVFGAFLALLSLPKTAWGDIITFSEVPPQTLHGVTIKGVSFDFRIGGLPSLDATIGLNDGPGLTPFNFPPNVEGNSNGILTLDFAVPTDTLIFGSHISVFGVLTPGLTVQLFDASLTPIGGPIGLNMASAPLFSGGQFNFGGTPVSRAVIDFSVNNQRFALDTVEFNPIPEPTGLALLGLGAVGLIGYGWCRPKRSA